jgi:phosphoglycerate dehydrogenase-like enzyme
VSQPLRILLNIPPYHASESQRQQIEAACTPRRVELRELDDGTDLEQIDPAGTEVLVTESVPRDLSRWPELRLVQLVSAGTNHLKDHPIWATPVCVATAAGTYAVPIAQYVVCTLLMLVHDMPGNASFKSTRRWPDRGAMAASMIRGKTAGIIGYGGIGRECARQLHSLGMRIVCLKNRPNDRHYGGFTAFEGTGDPEGVLPARWFGRDGLREMLSECDVVVVTAPRTEQTFGMIGASELSLLPKGARVIVVSRGGIVDESALAEALHEGRLAGAAVDTYVQEPPDANDPLFDAPNLIMTPHMSGVFTEYWDVFCALLCQNLGRHVRGEPLLNQTDGRLGY